MLQGLLQRESFLDFVSSESLDECSAFLLVFL